MNIELQYEQGSTMCPRSSDPSYIVTYYMKRVTTSCTYSIFLKNDETDCLYSFNGTHIR